MDTLLMTTGALILTILFYLIYHSRLIARGYAVSKFKYNREKNIYFYNELTEYVSTNNIAHLHAFEDSDITYGEIIEVLEEKFTIEFSETQLTKLLYGRFSDAEISDFVERMEHHHEIIKALQVNFRHKFESYGCKAIA